MWVADAAWILLAYTSSYSADSTSSLGTSICRRYSHKKKKEISAYPVPILFQALGLAFMLCILTAVLQGSHYHYSHFADKETEAQPTVTQPVSDGAGCEPGTLAPASS